MFRSAMILVVAGGLLLGLASLATAQGPGAPAGEEAQAAPHRTDETIQETVSLTGRGLIAIGACLGAGLIIIGGAKGIGMIGSHAVDSIARQPEAATAMFLAWLLPAAMIEGATLFAVVVCLLALLGQ